MVVPVGVKGMELLWADRQQLPVTASPSTLQQSKEVLQEEGEELQEAAGAQHMKAFHETRKSCAELGPEGQPSWLGWGLVVLGLVVLG